MREKESEPKDKTASDDVRDRLRRLEEINLQQLAQIAKLSRQLEAMKKTGLSATSGPESTEEALKTAAAAAGELAARLAKDGVAGLSAPLDGAAGSISPRDGSAGLGATLDGVAGLIAPLGGGAAAGLKIKEMQHRLPADYLQLSAPARTKLFASWRPAVEDLAEKHGLDLNTLRMHGLPDQQRAIFAAVMWAAMERPMRTTFDNCLKTAGGVVAVALGEFSSICMGEAATLSFEERARTLPLMGDEPIRIFYERYNQAVEDMKRRLGRPLSNAEEVLTDRHFMTRLSGKTKDLVRPLEQQKATRAQMAAYAIGVEASEDEEGRLKAQATAIPKQKAGVAASAKRITMAAGEDHSEADYEEELDTTEQPATALVATGEPQDICTYCKQGNHAQHVCMKRIRDEKKVADEKRTAATDGQGNAGARSGAGGRGGGAKGRSGWRGGGRGGGRGSRPEN